MTWLIFDADFFVDLIVDDASDFYFDFGPIAFQAQTSPNNDLEKQKFLQILLTVLVNLGVKDRNMKMDYNTGGIWLQVE